MNTRPHLFAFGALLLLQWFNLPNGAASISPDGTYIQSQFPGNEREVTTQALQEYKAAKKMTLKGVVSLHGPDDLKGGLTGIQVQLFSASQLTLTVPVQQRISEDALARLQPQIEQAKGNRDLFNAAVNQKLAAGTLSEHEAELTQRKLDQTYSDLLEQQINWRTGEYYFKYLPTPLATAVTDANGRFALLLPAKGSFIIAARMTSSLAGGRNYYWLIKISHENLSDRRISLDAGNMSSAHSASSLISTNNL